MDIDFEIIKNLELKLSNPEGRKDTKCLSEIFSDNFEEIGKSGRVFNKNEILSLLSNEESQKIELNDFKFIRLSEFVILAKYSAFCNGVNSLRSSIWVKNTKDWKILHHQGTACK